MPHVRVERLGAGDGEHHGAEHDERFGDMRQQETQRVQRIQCLEHRGLARDAIHPGRADGDEPEERHRPKKRPTVSVPRAWKAKSAASTPTAIGTT